MISSLHHIKLPSLQNTRFKEYCFERKCNVYGRTYKPKDLSKSLKKKSNPLNTDHNRKNTKTGRILCTPVRMSQQEE